MAKQSVQTMVFEGKIRQINILYWQFVLIHNTIVLELVVEIYTEIICLALLLETLYGISPQFQLQKNIFKFLLVEEHLTNRLI